MIFLLSQAVFPNQGTRLLPEDAAGKGFVLQRRAEVLPVFVSSPSGLCVICQDEDKTHADGFDRTNGSDCNSIPTQNTVLGPQSLTFAWHLYDIENDFLDPRAKDIKPRAGFLSVAFRVRFDCQTG